MRKMFQLIAVVLAMVVPPAWAQPNPASAQPSAPPPLILISIDGFRWDYLDRGISPNLSAMAAGGVRAERMIPAFPSVTFPNHYTLVTGLYPDHHGIVNNSFEDAAMKTPFTMASKEPAWWNEATPIWVTAEQSGIRTGIMFWLGSEVAIQDIRPSYWVPFDHALPDTARVDKLLGWLDLPAGQRPRFMTLYFNVVDGTGHEFGPDSPEVNQTIAEVDAAIGRLQAGLANRGVAANIILVADHGMAPVAASHPVLLDDLINPKAVHVVFDDTVLGVDIPPTRAGAHAEAKLLAPHAPMQCWRKAEIPARLHYGTNSRVPDVVCAAQTGWLIETKADVVRNLAKYHSMEKGAHGYDNQDPLMGALFIVSGPAFRAGLTIKPFPNIDVYPLMTHLLGLTPRPNDGDLADLAPILK